MKLISEAIMAGSVLVPEMKNGDIDACALGMAADAIGIPRSNEQEGPMPRYEAIRKQWPWLEFAGDDCPKCGVRHWDVEVIYHVFDSHVMGDKSMTLEQLVDYVRTIEPPELLFTCHECGEKCARLYSCTECHREQGECCHDGHRENAHSSDSATAAEQFYGVRL